MARTWQSNRHKCHVTTLPLLIATISWLVRTTLGDVGTSSQYAPPYIPTSCYGRDSSKFPTSNLFAAAGDGIWDNGASCGRQYQVRCISAATPGTCVEGTTILVKIVDYAASLVSRPSAAETTMVLSHTAFQAIANSTAASVNVEFQQV